MLRQQESMPKIKERDILRFLDGRSDPFELKNLQEWLQEDESRSRELELIQLIYEEASLINTYEPINIEEEWTSFKKHGVQNIQAEVADIPVIEDIELLNYLDGLAESSTIDKIKKWESSHPENKRDLEIYRIIRDESPGVQQLQLVDTVSEFDEFQKRLKLSEQETEVVKMHSVPETAFAEEKGTVQMFSKSESGGFKWKYAIAACLTLLVAAAIWFYWPRAGYVDFQAGANPETIVMEDGTRIILEPFAKLRYPKRLSKHKERRVYLNGKAEFDVARIENKPFTVETTTDVGLTVLGTRFKFEKHESYQEVIEMFEGNTRANSLKKPSINVKMTGGDKYGYDGKQFIDMRPKVVDNSKEYNILHVLDFLMQESRWTVISTPYMPFDEEGVVRVNLEQDVLSILEELKEKADFEYLEMKCKDCYKITKFKQKLP